MEIMAKVREWAKGLADVGISIAALMIVVEVLGLGNIPFFRDKHHRKCFSYARYTRC